MCCASPILSPRFCNGVVNEFSSQIVSGWPDCLRTAFICVRKCKGPDSDGPPSLSPGDQYRLGFVTSEGISATSPNIGDYNIFAQSIAEAVPELAALGADWSAVASTESVNARENTGTDPLTDGPGIPIFLIDGSKIADDNSDLWDGDIDTAFNLREDEVIVQGGVLDRLECLWRSRVRIRSGKYSDARRAEQPRSCLDGEHQERQLPRVAPLRSKLAIDGGPRATQHGFSPVVLLLCDQQ